MIVMLTREFNPNVFAHKQVVRRDYRVAPFEPHKIAQAMLKALLAIFKTHNRGDHQSGPDKVLASSYARLVAWRRDIWNVAREVKRAMTAQVGHPGTSMRGGAQVGSNSKGFFSASKPNLRNAP